MMAVGVRPSVVAQPLRKRGPFLGEILFDVEPIIFDQRRGNS